MLGDITKEIYNLQLEIIIISINIGAQGRILA